MAKKNKPSRKTMVPLTLHQLDRRDRFDAGFTWIGGTIITILALFLWVLTH